MNAEILKTRPKSGDLEESLFDAIGDVLCVKFSNRNTAFCAVLGGGTGQISKVSVIGDVAFIVSFGQGYIINLIDRKLIHKTTHDDLCGVLGLDSLALFVTHDNTDLYVYEKKCVWCSGRVSSDGIKLDRVEGNSVIGRIFDFQKWTVFSLDLKALEFQCDSDLRQYFC